jgi:hypothetical protein
MTDPDRAKAARTAEAMLKDGASSTSPVSRQPARAIAATPDSDRGRLRRRPVGD